MAGINYARWDNLEDSSDEEVFHRPPAARSPRKSTVTSRFATPDPLPHPDPELDREIREEQAELRAFVIQNDFPTEERIKKWLLRMVQEIPPSPPPGVNMAWVMRGMGWTKAHLGWLHYESLRALWTSGGQDPAAAFDAQRRAGVELYRRGGRGCMQFNFYVLHHAMCSEYFLPHPPRVAFGFNRHLENVWDGIGSWQG